MTYTEKPKLQPCYSGPLSKHFWEAINALPPEAASAPYFAGVLLQEMEARVLLLVNSRLRTEPRQPPAKAPSERVKSVKPRIILPRKGEQP